MHARDDEEDTELPFSAGARGIGSEVGIEIRVGNDLSRADDADSEDQQAARDLPPRRLGQSLDIEVGS